MDQTVPPLSDNATYRPLETRHAKTAFRSARELQCKNRSCRSSVGTGEGGTMVRAALISHLADGFHYRQHSKARAQPSPVVRCVVVSLALQQRGRAQVRN